MIPSLEQDALRYAREECIRQNVSLDEAPGLAQRALRIVNSSRTGAEFGFRSRLRVHVVILELSGLKLPEREKFRKEYAIQLQAEREEALRNLPVKTKAAKAITKEQFKREYQEILAKERAK